VASEDVVYLLERLGMECGVDLHKLIKSVNFISQKLGRDNQSKVARALTAKQ